MTEKGRERERKSDREMEKESERERVSDVRAIQLNYIISAFSVRIVYRLLHYYQQIKQQLAD